MWNFVYLLVSNHTQNEQMCLLSPVTLVWTLMLGNRQGTAVRLKKALLYISIMMCCSLCNICKDVFVAHLCLIFWEIVSNCSIFTESHVFFSDFRFCKPQGIWSPWYATGDVMMFADDCLDNMSSCVWRPSTFHHRYQKTPNHYGL